MKRLLKTLLKTLTVKDNNSIITYEANGEISCKKKMQVTLPCDQTSKIGYFHHVCVLETTKIILVCHHLFNSTSVFYLKKFRLIISWFSNQKKKEREGVLGEKGGGRRRSVQLQAVQQQQPRPAAACSLLYYAPTPNFPNPSHFRLCHLSTCKAICVSLTQR